MGGPHRWSTCLALLVAWTFTLLPARAAETVYPVADGTLADGGVFGTRDGVADSYNWAFGPSGFAGAVTLTTETPASAVEHRMVFEYNLRQISLLRPIRATLAFTTRGVNVLPFPDVTLHVYAYPGDLIETPADYFAGPAELLGTVTVSAMQPPKRQLLDVSALVTSALYGGAKIVAFRFQIDPNTPHAANQVFIDALDTEPTTKPLLTLGSATPGDADGDSDTDFNDFTVFVDCLAGPNASPAPSKPGVDRIDCLWAFDHDGDDDVDLHDLSHLVDRFREP